jgi:antitoxin ParD1/3/4
MPVSYTIGSHFENLIKEKIQSGRYSNASEVIREALRLFEEREELRKVQIDNLRRKLIEGIESGPGIPAEEVFSRLETKYGKMIEDA